MTEAQIVGVDDVRALTGLERNTLILWSDDNRFPKHLKRPYTNSPYRWRRVDVEKWLDPKSQKSDLTEERVREMIQTELIKILRSTAPADRPAH